MPLQTNSSHVILARASQQRIARFAREADLASLTPAFLIHLVGALVDHKQEGSSYFPDVFLWERTNTPYPTPEQDAFILVARAPIEQSGIDRMLLLCAPLAVDGWLIFCELDDEDMAFGIFQPDALPPQSICNSAVTIRQDGDGTILLGSSRAKPYSFPATTAAHATDHTIEHQRALLDAIVHRSVPDTCTDRIRHVLSLAIGESDGCLVAVVDRDASFEATYHDAVVLQTPIDLPRLFELEARNRLPSRIVRRYEPLAGAMVRSDGIVVFDNAARLRAYRWFVSPASSLRAAGGARERAFWTLVSMVSSGTLDAAFVHYHDGATNFVRAAVTIPIPSEQASIDRPLPHRPSVHPATKRPPT